MSAYSPGTIARKMFHCDPCLKSRHRLRQCFMDRSLQFFNLEKIPLGNNGVFARDLRIVDFWRSGVHFCSPMESSAMTIETGTSFPAANFRKLIPWVTKSVGGVSDSSCHLPPTVATLLTCDPAGGGACKHGRAPGVKRCSPALMQSLGTAPVSLFFRSFLFCFK